ncbi:hypothetical protein C7974DRAFT_449980 [Boeremia exigua]|uniref:uncharacterized protein n=1 Tax=Boeremia exigua TaxID=749465 RepID=UPI001E8EEF18|nr:uncharacterized protein C7974DRAFT_449980 [Boeremia exigua]KAH6639790.1 hypothetical protein C7974DRAFT_449980 [Boeremia exigua]
MSRSFAWFWRVLLLQAALVTITVSCIPPFNDFKYTDNATLLEEAVLQHDANPAMGWAHVLGGTSPIKPWPKDDAGLVKIKYCWSNSETREKLREVIQGGWEVWHELLGAGGPDVGHRLGGLSEHVDGEETIFCWLDEDRQEWNPKVPSGTLVIDIIPDKTWGGFATMGYNPVDWDNRPHRNQLRMGWSKAFASNPAFQHWIAAHEIGHVFGLTHEHQRPDRDHYVHFECKYLANYNKAEQIARTSTSMTMDKLCQSPIYSLLWPWNQLNFVPHEYSTQGYYDMHHTDQDGKPDGFDHRYTVTHDRDYDLKSIMHYPSVINVASGGLLCLPQMPLVAWKEGGEEYEPPKEATIENAVMIGFNLVPTESDLKAVKMLYPWEG